MSKKNLEKGVNKMLVKLKTGLPYLDGLLSAIPVSSRIQWATSNSLTTVNKDLYLNFLVIGKKM